MMAFGCVALLAALCGSGLGAEERYPVDWNKLQPEILERFATLLKLDTSNPPGNETRVAEVVEAALQREGIPVQLFSSEPSRANLVARLKGNGSKRPLLIMGHTDVVGVQRERWSVDPFGAVRKDGLIYSRGANDDKDHVVAGLMVMLLLKRMQVKLDRDVIFLAEAGEEGTTQVGIDYMVSQHWPEIEAEYAMAEGGSVIEADGRMHHVLINVTEKVPRGARLIARGPSGHGSRPSPQNPVVHLAAAVAKAGAWQTPLRLNEATRAYFERLAAISPPREAARYRAILDPARTADVDRYFFEHEPGHYTLLRTSVVPTMVQAGFRANVIPSEAEAYVDIRALPDEDMSKFFAELRRVINDPTIEVVPAQSGGRPAAPPSRTDNVMFHAFESVSRAMFHAPVLPSMLAGATDCAQLRAKGVECYGFGPIASSGDGPLGGAHSDDENIAISALLKLVEFLWKAVIEVAAS
ncbi:MAG TPA: M20/M25/M40 family metallo-hydrolase [Bryobacteraceae bacterium]|jgi:acetylornithine deacetylase/succinyl-diaminopimelate desuccinylase-like protein|nr:M20/M25/M40 family metallo-hydrolase [Bryobacteraceae bacterium]